MTCVLEPILEPYHMCNPKIITMYQEQRVSYEDSISALVLAYWSTVKWSYLLLVVQI